MKTQACPNCHVVNDTAVYVTGQRCRCVRCGISFDVRHAPSLSVVQRTPGLTSLQRPSGERPRLVPAEVSGPHVEVSLESLSPSGDATAAQTAAASTRAPSAEATDDDGMGKTLISKAAPKLNIQGYELLEVLGRGGMGEVWRAHQKSLGRVVAIKVLPPKLAADPEFVARFSKESSALASLSHPNITQIIDRGVEDDHYYFVMEFVPGKSLREVMSRGRVNPAECLKIICQICRAIEYAHDQKIIHRDLKPENILLDDRGNLKVADFGLAGMQQGTAPGPQLTATAVAMGTVNYMAPEQRRDAKHVDGRADLYSMGVILYEMLTSELPLGRFKLPSEKLTGLDPRFDSLLARLLDPDPDARYLKAHDVLLELEQLLLDHTSASHAQVAGIVTPSPASHSATTKPQAAATQGASSPRVLVDRGWKSVRVGLTVVGLLAVLGMVVRMMGGKWEMGKNGFDVEMGEAKFQVPLHMSGARGLPPNTDGELMADSSYEVDRGGMAKLKMRFAPGQEVLHAHAGQWELSDGMLRVTQAGNQTTGTGALIPRAYVDDRLFSSDDFSAEVEMRVKRFAKDEFRQVSDARGFGELAFRLNDVQISAFADPENGMRLAWKYPTPQGEQAGDSGKDTESGLADVVPVPTGRSFNLRLTLHRKETGTQVQAAVNDQVFASRFLPGLKAQPGKVALGCRNLHCWFESMDVQALPITTDALAKGEHGEH